MGEGLRWMCFREIQKSLKESAKHLIESKLEKFGLGEQQGFKVFRDVIETPGGGLIAFTGLQDHTADSIKSYEGFQRAWGEEAHSLTDHSLTLLRPTIRSAQSELWFSWNPTRPTDAVDKMLRGPAIPSNSTVIHADWRDNPWFPDVLEQERQDDLNNRPERYGHIWEGEYATVFEGAYFAKHLTVAQQEGRIGFFSKDPLQKVYAFWDIAGTSDKADAVAIWIIQFVGAEIRVIDYYEVIGQPFDAHVRWLRDNGYEKSFQVLPHDGVKHDNVYAVTPEKFLLDAGFGVDVVPNQGRGAALQRIDAVRQVIGGCRFNDEKTLDGREALGWYHERRDEHRNMGLGPDHDWSSHGADAFGLMAVWWLKNKATDWGTKPIRRNLRGIA